ncbi:bifunctional 4-hydroxy-2-oxoglutarate aldolase/2-dehydro-3-deoxy-phosphogluconate aldolase [Dactylosporangium sp. CA-139066]|uniref:bifunctional 4-hydroxy-2-oxoglutarate aldolase/2-dehydro-3-deoxy-phosphogluconate aldolase n=1 Tax=Dactylosporangium sp. CA-139066 TaxID=3239930 RepID=UPI003D89B337
MYRWDVMQTLAAQRVLGIIRVDGADAAVRAGETLIDAGLRVIEVSLTTPGALPAIERLAARHTGCVVGAGTVLDEAAARAAIAAGARLVVSPNLQRAVVRTAHRYGVAVIPGAATPTEWTRALEWGADAVKLFPASAQSPAVLRDVLAALPQVPVVATGGVSLEAAPQWIAAGAVACGIGSALSAHGGDAVSRLLARLAEAR